MSEAVIVDRQRPKSMRPLVLAGLLGVLVGYLGSQMTTEFKSVDSQLFNVRISFPVVHTILAYNKTFGASPFDGDSTLNAWDSIVPGKPFNQSSQGQKVTEPFPRSWSGHSRVSQRLSSICDFVGGPPAALSVVDTPNTLHSFIKLINKYRGDEGNHSDHTIGHSVADQRLPHVRHCFDYLRQTLMCASDTTLELINPELGGATGWGTEKMCRSYEHLKVWAEDHGANNQHGFREWHHEH